GLTFLAERILIGITTITAKVVAIIAICIVSIKRSIAGPTIPQFGGKSLSVMFFMLPNPVTSSFKSTPVLAELANRKARTMIKIADILALTRQGDNNGA